ncbi:MAG TPA: hypothetical protein VG675_22975 [Bryobacteraceae bacterium]|nr:hypothetical protein [Bryobacteraceae bacterium]
MGGHDYLQGDRNNRRVPRSSHEYYEELCALATTGTLTDREWNRLRAHLAHCGECGTALRKYREIARTGMPLLMTEESMGDHSGKEAWTPEFAKRDLFARIAKGDQVAWSHDAALRSQRLEAVTPWRWLAVFRRQAGFQWAAALGVVVLALALGYQYGVRTGRERARRVAASEAVQSAATRQNAILATIDALTREKASLDQRLKDRNRQIDALARQVKSARASLDQLVAAKQESDIEAEQNLEKQRDEVAQANSRATSITQKRDALTAKLRDAESTLASTETALNRLRDQRASDLLYTATLEHRIGDLSSRLKKQDDATSLDTQLLASDRDIRELMGARDLYIADVFDVDPNGRTERPFGRVFYTRGKSLIFYAFDLDKQRNVRNASTFQAWGRRGREDAHPVNMGIFYMDNEANRRWVLKFDDPKTLARIDTVFVTVEPNGHSETPRGKPLLFASLRSQPNHP